MTLSAPLSQRRAERSVFHYAHNNRQLFNFTPVGLCLAHNAIYTVMNNITRFSFNNNNSNSSSSTI